MPPKQSTSASASRGRGRPAANSTKSTTTPRTGSASKAAASDRGSASAARGRGRGRGKAAAAPRGRTQTLGRGRGQDEDDGDEPKVVDLDGDELDQSGMDVNRDEEDDDEEDDEEEEEERQKIPPELLTRIVHQFFEQEGTRVTRDANAAVARYVDVFVREAIARAAAEREGGFLEVSIPFLFLWFSFLGGVVADWWCGRLRISRRLRRSF